MPGFKRAMITAAAAAAIACTSMAPAAAGPRGFGHLHPWGLGRGLVGAVVGLATLPLAIASAAIEASVPEAPAYAYPGYDAGARGYAPAGYYAPPAPAYYAAPYYAAPRMNYAPRAAAVLFGSTHLPCTACLLRAAPRAVTPAMLGIVRAAMPTRDVRGSSREAWGMERKKPTKAGGRGGRPTRADGLRLRRRILEVATELFLARGLRVDDDRSGGGARGNFEAYPLPSIRRQVCAVHRRRPRNHRADSSSCGSSPDRGGDVARRTAASGRHDTARRSFASGACIASACHGRIRSISRIGPRRQRRRQHARGDNSDQRAFVARCAQAEARRGAASVRHGTVHLHGRHRAAAPGHGVRYADDAGGTRGLGRQDRRSILDRMPGIGRLATA